MSKVHKRRIGFFKVKNKKAGYGVIIAIISIILFLGLIITGIIIANQKGIFKRKENNEEQLIDFFIRARDSTTQEFVDANYVLDYNQKPPIVVSQGELNKDEWLELKVPQDKLLHLRCWSDNNYLVVASKLFSQQEILSNLSNFICSMERIGNIKVEHQGNLKEGNSPIKLNISCDDTFYKMGICISWTAGILDVYKENQWVLCDSGIWNNWSIYNTTTQKYTLLDEGYYRCGNCEEDYCEWIKKCEQVEGNKCKSYSMTIPLRFAGKVDECFYIGKSLRNESYEEEFVVKSEDLNENDEVTFYIFDSDRRFSPIESMWVWMSEKDGMDLGYPDINYTIK